MRLIVCVEDRMGMLFHARRLSRDREATRRIVQLAGQGPLWVSPYSQGLFQECPPSGGLRVVARFSGLCRSGGAVLCGGRGYSPLFRADLPGLPAALEPNLSL